MHHGNRSHEQLSQITKQRDERKFLHREKSNRKSFPCNKINSSNKFVTLFCEQLFRSTFVAMSQSNALCALVRVDVGMIVLKEQCELRPVIPKLLTTKTIQLIDSFY